MERARAEQNYAHPGLLSPINDPAEQPGEEGMRADEHQTSSLAAKEAKREPLARRLRL